MSRTLVPVLRAIALVALALVLAHELTFLLRYGSIYGEALVHAGHGAAWSDAVRLVLVASGVALAASLVALLRLGLRLRGRRAVGGQTGPTVRALGGSWLRGWASLGVTVALLLTVQENVEHAVAGLGTPGPLILTSPEYPFALAIVALVALAISFVGALLAWRFEVLRARLRAVIATPRFHARRDRPLPAAPFLVRGSTLARRLGRRAPPILRLA